MPEVQRAQVAVAGCYARPEALDALALSQLQIRVAPDELLVVATASTLTALAESATERLREADEGGIVFDVSDGYAAWTLRGNERLEAFARLCAIAPPKPPACLQGLFAQVPAKIVFGEDDLLVLVSSVLGHYLLERILIACDDLDPRELPAAPLPIPAREGTA